MRLRDLLPGVPSEDTEQLSAAVAPVTPVAVDLANSNWHPTHQLARVLDGVVFTDMFGEAAVVPVTRAEA